MPRPNRGVALNVRPWLSGWGVYGQGEFSHRIGWKREGSALPLPDAKLQKMQQHQPPVTLMPICLEPQIAQGLDQEAGQENREGQPAPEEMTCGKVVNDGAEAWGERKVRVWEGES